MTAIITPSQLEEKIRSNLSNVIHVHAVDQSDGCGAKYEILIVSNEFIGKQKLAQHRLVHKAIEEETKLIHALTIKTKTEADWNKEKEQA
jgi:stress-induced morphogen